MSVYVAILAAGSGTRFGTDKMLLNLRGKPIWRWSFDSFLSHPEVDGVGIVASESNVDAIRASAPEAAFVVLGGANRPESSRTGFEAMPSDTEIALIHDGARPLIDHQTISNVIAGVRRTGAAAASVPAIDTIKRIGDGALETLDRSALKMMQTPQGGTRDVLTRAYTSPTFASATDEMSMVESIGLTPELVEGSRANLKVTEPFDLQAISSYLGVPETRTGMGYDIHSFSEDPARELWLGGVRFEGHRGLDGHSDADALLHAVTDSLLGAVAMGDIGVHFPNTDPRWKGEPSLTFLTHAGKIVGECGWSVRNIDITVIAESPKVMVRANEIREAIAGALSIDVGRVSLKATTNEKLGSIGRGEGIAALAIATVVQAP